MRLPESKDLIIHLWRKVNRPGIEELIDYLNTSDFFAAPCSVRHHLAVPGGLAKHSHNVYGLLEEKVARYGLETPEETTIICGLGHDLCKVNFYAEGGNPCSEAQYNYLKSLAFGAAFNRVSLTSKVEFNRLFLSEEGLKRNIPSDQATVLIDWLKNKPQTEIPEFPIAYSYDDKFPYGHGERSVSILQDFIKLTEEEKLAIRWHMGPFTDGFTYPSISKAYNAACDKYPLLVLLFTADYEASRFLEAEKHE